MQHNLFGSIDKLICFEVRDAGNTKAKMLLFLQTQKSHNLDDKITVPTFVVDNITVDSICNNALDTQVILFFDAYEKLEP